MELTNRRISDIQIPELILRVDVLAEKVDNIDSDMKKLRTDFESHVVNEDFKYKEIKTSIDGLQKTVESLSKTVETLIVEIKEPLESYKTAKYGVAFLRVVSNTAKWAIPLLLALFIGYSYQSKDIPILKALPAIEGK